MDNLTHGLTGALIARTLPADWNGEPTADPAVDPDAALTRPGRWLTPAAVIAANLPDSEALFLWPPPLGDKAAYLMHHRGWSHSLVGIAGETLLFAGLLWLLARRWGTGGRWAGFTFARGLTVAGLGAGSHLFLDWWNSYGVRPFYPWDKSWYYGDLVFIVDPWVWLMLGGALVCGTRRFGRAKWGWYGLAAVGTVVVTGACWKEQCPWWVLAGWLTGAVEIALLRWWGRWRKARWIGWGLVGAYLAAMNWVTAHAWQSSNLQADGPASALPVAGVPWERLLIQPIARDSPTGRLLGPGRTILTGRVAVLPRRLAAAVGGSPGPSSRLALLQVGAADPAEIDRHANDPRVRAWRSFARFPSFGLHDGGLLLGDFRYSADGGSDWSELRVPLD